MSELEHELVEVVVDDSEPWRVEPFAEVIVDRGGVDVEFVTRWVEVVSMGEVVALEARDDVEGVTVVEDEGGCLYTK